MPSAALVLMLLVLTAIECPVQDVSLLWTIDWFVDRSCSYIASLFTYYVCRCRTTNNMLGDCYGAAIVEKLSSHELNLMDKLDKEGDSEHIEKNSDSNKESLPKEMTSI